MTLSCDPIMVNKYEKRSRISEVKIRFSKFRDISKKMFYLHLKECEF